MNKNVLRLGLFLAAFGLIFTFGSAQTRGGDEVETNFRGPDDGRVMRPDAEILPAEAIVETRNREMEQRRQEMLERAEERRVLLSEGRRERVNQVIDNVMDQLLSRVRSLNEIAIRLENRVDLALENDLDVGNAEEKLTEVFIALEDVVIEIEVIRNRLKEAMNQEISIEYIRYGVSSVRDSLMEIHTLLREVILEINN